MFAETNDNVAGVEAENRRLLGAPPASACGVELSPDGLRQALDSHLAGAIRASGKVPPDQVTQAVEMVRGRFDVAFSRAGTTALVSRDGRAVDAVIVEALAQANPQPPESAAVRSLREALMQHPSARRENRLAGIIAPFPIPKGT